MIILTLIFIGILPFVNYFFFKQKKINSILFLAPALLFFNILNILFVGMSNLKHYIVSPIYITVLVLLFLSLFIFCYLQYRKDKSILSKDNLVLSFKKYAPLLISWIIFFLIIIFVNSYFPDTQAYLSASFDYLNGFEPSFHDGGTINLHYKVMPMIIVYPSLFGQWTPVAYYILNPFIMCFIYTSILNEWFVNEEETKILSMKYILKFVAILAISIFCPFLSSFMTSGNIFPQASILLISFSVLFYSKEKWLAFLPISFLQFLSATGYINGIIMSMVLLAFIVLTSDFKNIFISLAIAPIFALFLPFFSKGNSTLYSGILFSLVSLWMITFTIIWFIFKEKICNLNNKLLNLSQNKYFQYGSIALLFLVGLLVFVIFWFVYYNSYLYTKQLSILTFVLFIAIGIFVSIRYIKQNKTTNIHFFFILASLASIIFISFVMIINSKNASVWRCIYLNFGMGGPIDITLLSLLIIKQIFNECEFKINKKILLTKWIVSSLAFIGIGSGFIGYNYAPVSIRLFSTSANVQKNIFQISASDWKLIKDLNHESVKLITDVQLNYLFNKANIHNNQFINYFNKVAKTNIPYQSNWTISAYSFAGALEASGYRNKDINKFIVETMVLMFNEANINTIILGKDSTYFKDVLSSFNNASFNIVEGEFISVIKKGGQNVSAN